MAATRHDIVVEQGSRFELNVAVKNSDGSVKDLTGYSGRMQVRKTVDDITVLLEASTANGRLSINAPAGIVSVVVPADITTLLTFNTGVYDLEVFTSAANVIRVASGFAALSLEVSR